MRIARPHDLDEALDAISSEPSAQLLAGGTDLMVEVNFGHRRPEAVVALRRIGEIRGWERDGDEIHLGAGLTYTEMEHELQSLPALASAARTVGSPQIRNVGTLGGNLGTASPAGDTLPVLSALGARIVVVGANGERNIPIDDFLTGVKRTSLATGEIIRSVAAPAVSGPQVFLKVGSRNAMVIAIASCALVLDAVRRTARCALGAVAPVPVRPLDAEQFASGEIDWDRGVMSEAAATRFGVLAAAASSPIDDHRSTESYRRHAVEVISRRAIIRATRQLAAAV